MMSECLCLQISIYSFEKFSEKKYTQRHNWNWLKGANGIGRYQSMLKLKMPTKLDASVFNNTRYQTNFGSSTPTKKNELALNTNGEYSLRELRQCHQSDIHFLSEFRQFLEIYKLHIRNDSDEQKYIPKQNHRTAAIYSSWMPQQIIQNICFDVGNGKWTCPRIIWTWTKYRVVGGHISNTQFSLTTYRI